MPQSRKTCIFYEINSVWQFWQFDKNFYSFWLFLTVLESFCQFLTHFGPFYTVYESFWLFRQSLTILFTISFKFLSFSTFFHDFSYSFSLQMLMSVITWLTHVMQMLLVVIHLVLTHVNAMMDIMAMENIVQVCNWFHFLDQRQGQQSPINSEDCTKSLLNKPIWLIPYRFCFNNSIP